HGETALMFAAAAGRADAIRLLTAKSADTKVTTKLVDLAVFAKEEQERFAQFQAQQGSQGSRGSQGSAGSQGSPGTPAAAGAQARGGRGRQGGVAGVDRQYSYTELVGYQGGLAAIHIAARQGSIDAVQALLDAGADINQRSTGDHITPIIIATINGHFDLAR